MRFGFHVSIAGGFARAVEQARALKCETIQLFSRNPQGWRLKELDPEDIAKFKQGIKALDICPVAVHMPYLPNPAAENRELYEKSIEALAVDLDRASRIGAQFVVMHMGRRREASEADALERMATAINRALQIADCRMPMVACPKLLLENTAGMGKSLGDRFEHLKAVIEGVDNPNRLGVVLDTAHVFEAGYDIGTKDGLNRTLKEFDAVVGLKRLHLLHLNDSRTDLGSRVDRHWHIGKGEIGLEGFRRIVNHPLLHHLPGIMETPKDSARADRTNMRIIRGLNRQE